MKEIIVLDGFVFDLNFKKLIDDLCIGDDGPQSREIGPIFREAMLIARPKAVYGAAHIDKIINNTLLIDGTEFKSRILRINCANADIVFPFAATCGAEIEQWSLGFEDILQKYWVECIKSMALDSAVAALMDDIKNLFHPGDVSMMNPGSLDDWPVSEQKNLFELLGPRAGEIDIALNESFIMTPPKSLSGIIFPCEMDFVNCLLCLRENCPGRRRPYNEKLHKERYKAP